MVFKVNIIERKSIKSEPKTTVFSAGVLPIFKSAVSQQVQLLYTYIR